MTTATLDHGRRTVRVTSGIDIVAGCWLIIAPFVLLFSGTTAAAVNTIIVGIVVLVLAIARVSGGGYRISWPSWVNFVGGLWLIAAPFIFRYSGVTAAVWNDVIMGIVVVIFAAWSASSTPSREST